MVGEMLRLLADSATSGTDSLSDKDKNHKHISSFHAFAVSVATRVGTGNLAGVATAIAIGGPGAVFWMWVIALIGSATAFMILISGLYSTPDLNGIALTQAALNSEIGAFGPTFIAIAILLFAFSSIIGNYYYGEANIRFMTSSNAVLTVYRVLSGGVLVMFGAMASLEIVWNLGDLCMALLTACNLVAIVRLGKYAFRLLEDYRQQKRSGIKEPTFHRSQMPEIEKDLMCWE